MRTTSCLTHRVFLAIIMLASASICTAGAAFAQRYDRISSVRQPRTANYTLSSTYIPVDCWVYPAALRLYSMGFLGSEFIGLRPWTRMSLVSALENSNVAIMSSNNDDAVEILAKLRSYLRVETTDSEFLNGDFRDRRSVAGIDTLYTRMTEIHGNTLRNSWHLGQTFANDYGRPYAPGFNNITGLSFIGEKGRFSVYVRGEYQHAPPWSGYSFQLAQQLTQLDTFGVFTVTPNFYQDTVPYANTAEKNSFRLQEAALSFHVLGHEISGGKTDAWLGPGMGGAFAWSNNAEDIYSFRINRIQPLKIPLLHHVLGPLRYDFFYGSLKGHNIPNNPWVHSEQFSFRPTSDFEFGFQRTVIFGGHGFPRTSPVTLHTFIKGFFDISDVQHDEKYSRDDPGARFTAFNFSWRLPYLEHWLMLYADMEAHDDVTPLSAPRRAAYRPGLYLSHVPGLSKLDLRVEAASTDFSTLRSLSGQGNYYELIQEQGYTNKGFIFGDQIGREAKGGQAWLTWHLSGNEFLQMQYMNKKTPKDFIPGGVTQNQFKLELLKRLGPNFALDAWYQFERWRAPASLSVPGQPLRVIGGPLYFPNAQTNHAITAQFTWYPKLESTR